MHFGLVQGGFRSLRMIGKARLYTILKETISNLGVNLFSLFCKTAHSPVIENNWKSRRWKTLRYVM